MSTELTRHDANTMLVDKDAFDQAYRTARLFASSQLVPQHLRDKPADCFIALHMAHRMGEDPLMIAQNIVIIQGTAGWKAQWLIGKANQSGVFRGRIRFRYEGEGDALSVTAYATLADEDEEVSATVDMKMAKAEGWTKNPKYQSMPRQMLSYRAASFLVRLYAPETTMGYQTAEELEDMAASGRLKDIEGQRGATQAVSMLASQTREPEDEPEAPAENKNNQSQEPDFPPDDEMHGNKGVSQMNKTGSVGAPQVEIGRPKLASQPSDSGQEDSGQQVPLYNAAGEVAGSYSRLGNWLKALEKMVEEAPEPNLRTIGANNYVQLELVARSGKADDRVAALKAILYPDEGSERDSTVQKAIADMESAETTDLVDQIFDEASFVVNDEDAEVLKAAWKRCRERLSE